jgi:hypothetical protein
LPVPHVLQFTTPPSLTISAPRCYRGPACDANAAARAHVIVREAGLRQADTRLVTYLSDREALQETAGV